MAVMEEGPNFYFRCRCHDVFHNGGFHMNHGSIGAVYVWLLILVAQVEDATNSGFGVGLAEVQWVSVGQENHVRLLWKLMALFGCKVE